ncbi:MAG: (2Fe-2S)-binding protein [Clostridium sp.]|uniref:(2Fe-2S)-binding protein n=1 Tax=Clostridium sp. TaxID=1506 RepID=UPI0030724CF0
MVKIDININGVDYRREVNPMMRLIDFLRDEMKLKGTKEGCGEGECGACTVILNGNTVNSCLILVGTIDGGKILTIEGVGKNGINPIQEAFMEVGASQCGYCTPGMVLSAKSLLDKNIDSTEEEIREGISGNLCRCTGYEKVVQGVILAQKKLR